jgi:hypothetical protein
MCQVIDRIEALPSSGLRACRKPSFATDARVVTLKPIALNVPFLATGHDLEMLA